MWRSSMEELLGWAVRGAQEQVAALLLDLGARLNSRNTEGLITAIQQPHFTPALITLLIDSASASPSGRACAVCCVLRSG